ncbi:MAG: redox-regulated ATPase YchF [Planctomycetes bacterium]|nr:redox-regulated ATPase YchF [Planctomycetota bacterium]
MKLGIIGKPSAGKTTLLALLSGIDYDTSLKFQYERKFHYTTIKVPDERLKVLTDFYQPKKTVEATLDIIDTEPILGPEERKANNAILGTVREADGIICVIPAYQKREETAWIAREIDSLKSEFLLADLDIVERRIEKLKANKGRGSSSSEEIHEEEKFLATVKEYIEAGKNMKEIHLTPLTEKLWVNYGLLSRKPFIIITNISELDLSSADKYAETLNKYPHCLAPSLKLEYEISSLPPEEQNGFLSDYGLKSLQTPEVAKLCYQTLGLQPFFTVGSDEVRAWTIRKGDTALIAAGKIHTDMARGFISAEVISYADWLASKGSMKTAREHGRVRAEGKEYIVKDGDIINLKFNV